MCFRIEGDEDAEVRQYLAPLTESAVHVQDVSAESDPWQTVEH
jgi:hypothetical protein